MTFLLNTTYGPPDLYHNNKLACVEIRNKIHHARSIGKIIFA